MGQVPWRNKDKTQKSPLKLLIWTALAGLIIGFLGIGQLAEDQLRIARNVLHKHKASGDIIFVAIDDKALKQVGRWPWSRATHATLTDKLTAAGVDRIVFDIIFEIPSDPIADQAFAHSITKSGKVVLAARGIPNADGGEKIAPPLPILRQGAGLATISARYNFQNAIWWLPWHKVLDGKPIPSMATVLSGRKTENLGEFAVDYSIDLESIPRVSAADILNGGSGLASLRGKQVVIGADSGLIGDLYFIPGTGQKAGAYVQIMGAETLKNGNPVDLGWLAAFLVALIVSAWAAFRKRWRDQALVLGTIVLALLIIPVPLEARLILVDVAPALMASLSVWGALLWKRYKNDGLTNAVSGMPNLAALRAFKKGRDQALVAARILNYAEIVASLPAEAERTLVEQIVGRLTVGSTGKIIYHGDGGIFAWFEEARLPFGHHIDALHSMFRNPVRVNGQTIDLAVSFGVEIGSGRSIANRLASALVAGEEAAHDGLKWKIHDPEKLNDASWKLSLLSRLDQAIDEGEVWVAYQPKLDLRSRGLIGAEALARWTHPDKGPISAAEFVAAAEQHDRIGKLTDFVLDQAIGAAASINAKGTEFHIAVNLSARLLDDKALEMRLSQYLLKHRLEPQLLTLELTETSALGPDALQMLLNLRKLGVEISIDDYGTGLSTLDYLKKVPANEIKIDQSFVKGMMENRSDRVMVQSTIAMAHSLGRTVVAEGVETREALEALADMKCDIAQGFIIGRPMSLDSLVRRLSTERKRSVA